MNGGEEKKKGKWRRRAKKRRGERESVQRQNKIYTFWIDSDREETLCRIGEGSDMNVGRG